MQGNPDWAQLAGLVIAGLFLVFFVFIAVLGLRKALRRRHEELSETPAEAIEARREEEALERGESVPVPPEAAEEPEEPIEEAHEKAPEVVAELPRPARDEALQRGLERTSSSFRERLGQIFGRHPRLDPAVADELEEALLTADVGVSMSTRLMDAVRGEIEAARVKTGDDVRRALREHMLGSLRDGRGGDPLAAAAGAPKPRVILFVGVNGVGKTTTIGKVAALARARGQEVVLAAGDTFRAAAVEQLAIWGQRTMSRIVRGEAGADPASVIYNAIASATKEGADLVLADTAGRLHTKTQLMDEIKKVKRSAGKARAGAPDEVWLVVDATTGQNALQQAREFHQALGLTGVILTKLDGTAKGGVVVAIADALKLPVRFVGVGEAAEDLRPFDPEAFVSAMFA